MFFFRLLFVRYFGAYNTGLYAFVETALGITTIVCALGISRGIPRDLTFLKTKKPELFRGYIRFIFGAPLLMSILIGALVIIFAGQIAVYFNQPPIMVTFLRLLAIIVPLRQLNYTIRMIYISEHRVLNHQISDVLIEKSVLFVGLIVCILFDLSLAAQVAVLALSILLSALYDIVTYAKKIGYAASGRASYQLTKWLSFAMPLFLTGFFAYVINWSSNLIISKYFSPQDLGIYSVAFSLAFFLTYFAGSIATLFLPIISEDYAKNRGKKIGFLFRKSATAIFVTTFPAFLVFALYGRQILSLLYGTEFAAGYATLLIASTALLVSSSLGFSQQILILHGRTFSILLISAISAGFNIAANILLIPSMGITGVVVANGLSITIQALLLYALGRTHHPLQFEWHFSMQYMLAGIIPALVGMIPFRLGLAPIIALPLAGILYVTLYALILRALRIFTKEDRKIIESFEKRSGRRLGFFKQFCQ
jgi:O-antigen/teichoic acid export membrane protein